MSRRYIDIRRGRSAREMRDVTDLCLNHDLQMAVITQHAARNGRRFVQLLVQLLVP